MSIMSMVGATILPLAVFSFCGCTTSEPPPEPLKKQAARAAIHESRMLSTVSQAYLAALKDQAKQSVHPSTEFSKNGAGVAYIEHVDGKSRVVYNGSPGKFYLMVGDLALSRDGSRLAYVALQNEKFKKIVVDGLDGPLFTEIGMPVFSPDGKHHLYTITEVITPIAS